MVFLYGYRGRASTSVEWGNTCKYALNVTIDDRYDFSKDVAGMHMMVLIFLEFFFDRALWILDAAK